MRLIAVEEAFSIPELDRRHPAAGDLGAVPIGRGIARHVAERLPDLTELRLEDMDRNGVDVQVLSLGAPGLQIAGLSSAEAVADARFANDYLAKAVAARPDRFAGFAAVPLQDPEAAAVELRRAVTELGLRGALVNDHTDGHYLDEPRFDVFWSALEELDVPLYLHPGAPRWTTGTFSKAPPSWSVRPGPGVSRPAVTPCGCFTEGSSTVIRAPG